MECPHCGSSAVGCDGSDVNCVCRDCGAVLEEGTLNSDPHITDGCQNVPLDVNFTPNGTEMSTLPSEYMKSVRSITGRSHTSKGKIQGLKAIRHLFKHLGVEGKPVMQEAIDMYTSVSSASHYKFQNLQKKEILAAICVLVVCRKHDIPITTAFISKTMGINEKLLKVAFLKFQKKSDIPVKPVNILDMVSVICGEQDEECIAFTKQIISVIKKSWITEGRYRDSVVMAANYFAWQALHFHSRHNVSLKEYAQKRGWRLTPSIQHRSKEMAQVFCSLASGLPWLADKCLDLKRVIYYLKDIVAYHNALMGEINSDFNSHIGSEKEAVDKAASKPQGQLSDDKLNKDNKDLNVSSSKYMHIVLPSSFMKARTETNTNINEETILVKHHPNIDSEILSEADIKDEELSLYIKQPYEIHEFSELSKKKFQVIPRQK